MWYQFYVTATINKINVWTKNLETMLNVPIFDPELERNPNMKKGSVMLKSISGSIGIDDFLVDLNGIDIV